MPEYRILQLGTTNKYRIQEHSWYFWWYVREWYGDYEGGTWEILEYDSFEGAEYAIKIMCEERRQAEERARATRPGWHIVSVVSCKDA